MEGIAIQQGGVTQAPPRGQLFGLTLSNSSTTGIIAAAGEAASDDTVPVLMTLGSAITKVLGTSWAVGSGNGGLDTGAVADTTYHVFLIMRPDTGVVDMLFSLSPTAPTMPTNYTLKRRIGSIVRTGGAILAFTQAGRNNFRWTTAATDRNSTSAVAIATLALTVPTGITVEPLLALELDSAAGNNIWIDLADGASGPVLRAIHANAIEVNQIVRGFLTDTSAQIRFAQTNFAGAPFGSTLKTYGFVDINL